MFFLHSSLSSGYNSAGVPQNNAGYIRSSLLACSGAKRVKRSELGFPGAQSSYCHGAFSGLRPAPHARRCQLLKTVALRVNSILLRHHKVGKGVPELMLRMCGGDPLFIPRSTQGVDSRVVVLSSGYRGGGV